MFESPGFLLSLEIYIFVAHPADVEMGLPSSEGCSLPSLPFSPLLTVNTNAITSAKSCSLSHLRCLDWLVLFIYILCLALVDM